MEETQAKKNTYYKWNDLEDLVNKAIKEGKPYIIFKTIKTEEYKYIQKVGETRLSELSNNINGIIFLVAFGLSLTVPFIFSKSSEITSDYNINLIAFIAIVIILFVMHHFKSFIKDLATYTGFVSGIIVGIILIYGILAILFIFNKSLIESIGFFCGIIISIICIYDAFNWKSEYTTCSKIILNAERKLLWMEIESKKSHSDTCHPPSNYSPAPESEENRSIE